MNKYDKHYSPKSTEELINKIKEQNLYKNVLEEEWYSALLVHIKSRNLTEDQQKKLDNALNPKPVEKKVEPKEDKNEDNIVKAGKALTNIVIVLLGSTVLVGLILIPSDKNGINYYAIAFIWIVSYIINLVLLYSAGIALKNYKKTN